MLNPVFFFFFFFVKYLETATFFRWPLIVITLQWKLYNILVVGLKNKFSVDTDSFRDVNISVKL